MATYYVIDNTDSVNNSSGLTLGLGDDALITSSGYVVATGGGSTGIYVDAYATNSILTVDGLVSGVEQGIYSLGTSVTININGDVYGGLSVQGSGDSVNIGKNGFISGGSDLDNNSQLINNGTIDVQNAQFQIDSGAGFINNGLVSSTGSGFFFDGDGSVAVTNTGTIQGGFDTYYNAPATASVIILNYGNWNGDLYLAPGDNSVTNTGAITGNISLGDGNDTVTNTGTITGDVNLGNGTNTLDSRNGAIDGTISAGSGNDIIQCGVGNDTISGGAGGDTIDGGGGNNTVVYETSSAGVYVDLTNGIARHGDASGDHLTNIQNITGSLNTDTLIGDNNDNVLDGALGNDTINGNAGNDTLIMLGKGNAHLNGGAGNDTIELTTADLATYGPAFSVSDHIDGGTGFDTLILTGTANVVFNSTTVTNIERIQMEDGYNYTLTTADATVAAGQTMQVDASALTGTHVLNFNGSAETDGAFIIDGGAGNDAIIGGTGNDQIDGGGGKDTLGGGAGSDTFIYNAVTDSTGTQFDTINNFNANTDSFSLPVSVAHVDAAVTSGALSASTFNGNLHAALNGHLAAGDAILFDPTSGTLAGHTFLVVDANGVAGYQTGADYVIDITGYTGTLTAGDFA